MCTSPVVLPEIPIVNIDDEIGQICILSPEVEKIPADEYQIFVYDISGGATFKTVLNSSVNCSLVNSLFEPPECAPFTISVKAINSAGSSDINRTILINEERSNLCECIKKQGIVKLMTLKFTNVYDLLAQCLLTYLLLRKLNNLK